MEIRRRHINAGGMVCTAISIARYVDPQNRYTSPKARITIHRLGCCVCILSAGEAEAYRYQTTETAGWILKLARRKLGCGRNQDRMTTRSHVTPESQSHRQILGTNIGGYALHRSKL